MADDGIYLTEEDADRLSEMLDDYESGLMEQQPTPQRRQRQAPIPHYLAKTTSTITALADDVPGSGSVEFWQITESDDVDDDFTIEVNDGMDDDTAFSFWDTEIGSDVFVWVFRDYISGKWIVLEPYVVPTIEIAEVDGSPDLSGISKIVFDQADGFAVSNPSTGVARIDFTGSITVQESDGSPSYSVDTIQVNVTDGFTVTNPSSTAQINQADATSTQAGKVSTGTQQIGGKKEFITSGAGSLITLDSSAGADCLVTLDTNGTGVNYENVLTLNTASITFKNTKITDSSTGHAYLTGGFIWDDPDYTGHSGWHQGAEVLNNTFYIFKSNAGADTTVFRLAGLTNTRYECTDSLGAIKSGKTLTENGVEYTGGLRTDGTFALSSVDGGSF